MNKTKEWYKEQLAISDRNCERLSAERDQYRRMLLWVGARHPETVADACAKFFNDEQYRDDPNALQNEFNKLAGKDENFGIEQKVDQK